MEQEIVWNAFHNVYWGTQISVYFWIVGASAGSFVISSLGWVFGIKKYKPVSLFASNASIGLLMIVPIVLIADLGQPWRFFHLINWGFWHYSSPMAWGAFLILSYPVSMMVYSWFIYRKNETLARIIGLISVLLAVSTHWYTGIVMELNPNRELNHTAMAPLIFLTGAFISGIGFLIILLVIRNHFLEPAKRIGKDFILGLGKMMGFGVLFDAWLIYCESVQMLYGNEEEYTTLTEVLFGVFQGPYLWMEILCSLALPLILIFSRLGKNVWAIVAAAILVDIGVFGMRIWWVKAGQFLQTFY